MSSSRFMAVDPSLTCSGWAMFEIESQRLISVGKIKSLPPRLHLAERLLDLQTKIEHIIALNGLSENDVLACEAPTTMRDPRAALRVEQVRCLFESAARSVGARVPGRINPRSVQFEIMGLRGKQLQRAIVKETAVFVVESTHAEELRTLGFDPRSGNLKKHQDIVDAILLGRLGMSWIRSAAYGGIPVEALFSQGYRARSL